MNGRFNQLLAGMLLLTFAGGATADATLENGTFLSGDMVFDETMGARSGTNLFHNFLRFDVNPGESATFTGAAEISHVIARVNGADATTIDGPLRSTIESADLFLLNANGVLFGENASIEIDGALYLSTATSLKFADGSQLLVSDSGLSGLTSAPPSAFGFSATPAEIAILQSSIDSLPGQDAPVNRLVLAGGELNLIGANIEIPGSDLGLVSLASSGEVQLSDLSFSAAEVTPGKVTLGGGSRINVSGDRPGAINIVAGDLMMSGGAYLFADSEGTGTGAGIRIELDGILDLSGGSLITTDALSSASGSPISINASEIRLKGEETEIASRIFPAVTGSGGSISLTAGKISLDEGASLTTTSFGTGIAGTIAIDTDSLELANNAKILSQAYGEGDAGSITIEAAGTIRLAGTDTRITTSTLFLPGDAGQISIAAAALDMSEGAEISSEGFFEAAGAPGTIDINANTVNLLSLARISTTNASLGSDGGAIRIAATTVTIDGYSAEDLSFSGITSTTNGSAAGGSVEIAADSIKVSDGAAIEALTEGLGNAGSILLTGKVEVAGGRIDATTLDAGPGGSITIAGALGVLAGGRVLAASVNNATGNAGTVAVAGDSVLVSDPGSSISSSTSRSGAAGGVEIVADKLTVTNGGSVETSSLSVAADAGTAGNLTINADTVTISGTGSQLAATTSGPAPGGSIRIDSDKVSLDNMGVVTVTASGSGNAGNIAMNIIGGIDLLAGASIRTDAAQSGGGNVVVETGSRLYALDSTITASSGGPETGDDGGNITIGHAGTLTPETLILANSSVVAQAVQGNGGKLDFYTGALLVDNDSLISATSELGNDGEVIITSPDNTIAGVLGTLSIQYAGGELLLNQPCAAAVVQDRSSLVIRKPRPQSHAPDDGIPRIGSCTSPTATTEGRE
ncbi:MAG: filamentous hemagglutinin N-terminal domain-containing protein [Pseudomonadota bacterium]